MNLVKKRKLYNLVFVNKKIHTQEKQKYFTKIHKNLEEGECRESRQKRKSKVEERGCVQTSDDNVPQTENQEISTPLTPDFKTRLTKIMT